MLGKRKINSFIIFTILCTLVFGFNAFAEGWQQDEYGWWYEDDDGTYPYDGVYEIDGDYYAFDDDGYLLTNTWFKSSDGSYSYSTGSGVIARNQWVEGTYYVGNDGEMLRNTYTPDGYYVGSDGQWTNPPVSSSNNYTTSYSSNTSSSYTSNSSSSNSGTSNVKKYTKDEIFAMADPYVANIPGARRLMVSDFGYGAVATYITNNGTYRVEFTRDPGAAFFGGTMGYVYSKSGYSR
ncbi:MAG: hypothetical protein E7232_13415 [Lachnospiraceae bacterium]|nr:hypothetical protein [Lachnospiraceae bacterium]